MSPSPAVGAMLGAVLALGAGLIWVSIPARRLPRLDERLAPYLGDPALRESAPERKRAGATREDRSGAQRAGASAAARDLIGPTLDRAAVRLARLLGGSASIERRLSQANSSLNVHAFRLSQVVWGAAAFVGALMLSLFMLAGDGGRSPLVLAVFRCGAAVAGVVLRDQRLSSAVRERERRMLAEFPTIADLLALAVAAGEAPTAALERVARNSSGELSGEIRRALADARAGDGLVRALDAVAERTSLDPLSRFVDGVVVALDRGTPLADVLRAQAADVREVRKRSILESGGRKEIAMMIPVVFLVLPVTVVFALYPGIVQISAVVP